MKPNRNLSQFKDPLLAELDQFKTDRANASAEPPAEAKRGQGNGMFVLGFLLVVALGVLGYYLFRAQDQIDSLSTDLASSKSQLASVSSDLQSSQSRIAELDQGLGESQQQLSEQKQQINRYRGLYQNLKSEQDEQTRELDALNVQKADQSAVSQLEDRADNLQAKLEDTGSRVEVVRSEVARLDSRSQDHEQAIGRNQTEIAEVRAAADNNASEIGEIRHSLEREYYNFELQEGSGYMKVFNIALSLKDTDPQKRQFDLYVMADNKVIQKKNHPVNEPILFYVNGKTKPYEVVVTRIDRKLVVGYLSVPTV